MPLAAHPCFHYTKFGCSVIILCGKTKHEGSLWLTTSDIRQNREIHLRCRCTTGPPAGPWTFHHGGAQPSAQTPRRSPAMRGGGSTSPGSSTQSTYWIARVMWHIYIARYHTGPKWGSTSPGASTQSTCWLMRKLWYSLIRTNSETHGISFVCPCPRTLGRYDGAPLCTKGGVFIKPASTRASLSDLFKLQVPALILREI